MYAVMNIGGTSYSLAWLLPPLLCIAYIIVNSFMIEIRAVHQWFPQIGLFSLFLMFARYTEGLAHYIKLFRQNIWD